EEEGVGIVAPLLLSGLAVLEREVVPVESAAGAVLEADAVPVVPDVPVLDVVPVPAVLLETAEAVLLPMLIAEEEDTGGEAGAKAKFCTLNCPGDTPPNVTVCPAGSCNCVPIGTAVMVSCDISVMPENCVKSIISCWGGVKSVTSTAALAKGVIT